MSILPNLQVTALHCIRTYSLARIGFSWIFIAVSSLLSVPFAHAQPNPANGKNPIASNLIRPEYYSALDYFADGQTAQAASVLEMTLSKARVLNNQRGIDSVPALVQMGECFYEQSDIALALERYDEALQISLLNIRWLSLLKNPPGSVKADTRARELPWANNARGTQMGSFTEAWPIALGSNEILLESPAGQGVVGKMVAIDALEILRCQAIALRRRALLLGPLNKYSPLSQPLKQAFASNLEGHAEAIQCGMNICLAMIHMGAEEYKEANGLLTQSLSLNNGMDHPLTPIALLALANIAIEGNDFASAEKRALEASIAACRAGQMQCFAESIELVGRAALANGHTAASQTLAQMITWATSKSRLAAIRGQVELAKLTAFYGDPEVAKKHCTQATQMLLPKQVIMPRSEAGLRYAEARLAFARGDIPDGLTALFESTAFLRGAGANSIGTPRLFQLTFTQQLASRDVLDAEQTEALLTKILASPSQGSWRAYPMENLAFSLSNRNEAIQQLTDLQSAKGKASELVALGDRIKRQRLRQFGELDARVFDLQMAFNGDQRFMTQNAIAEVEGLRKQISLLDQNVSKLHQTLSPLRSNPKWDMRKWTEDDTKRWEAAAKLVTAQEAMLWATAIGPAVVHASFPPAYSQEALVESLQPDDAVVVFSSFGNSMKGFLWRGKQWKSWDVPEPETLQQQTQELLNELVTLKGRETSGPAFKKNWSVTKSLELRKSLFPKDVWQALQSADRWIVVPDRFVWYVPFDLLPLTDQATALPAIAEHRIVLSPTLGLVPFLMDAPKAGTVKTSIDVCASDFLSKDAQRAKELREELGKFFKSNVVDMSARTAFAPPGLFFKVSADRVANYSTMTWENMAPIASDTDPKLASIFAWRRLPWGTPSSVALVGVNTLPTPSQFNGDEWLRLSLLLIAQGTRDITISRWSVGGESTANLLRNYYDSQLDMPLSAAWQRSVLSLWEESLDQRGEPLFDQAPNPDSVISGNHPLLWSGYLRIGDSK